MYTSICFHFLQKFLQICPFARPVTFAFCLSPFHRRPRINRRISHQSAVRIMRVQYTIYNIIPTQNRYHTILLPAAIMERILYSAFHVTISDCSWRLLWVSPIIIIIVWHTKTIFALYIPTCVRSIVYSSRQYRTAQDCRPINRPADTTGTPHRVEIAIYTHNPHL